ncbi:MAG TPA: septum formation initiator family protein [Stellaceae bacterium]|jgi:cell division protein FtsB|nr:septum formation initiator family protein [Stellaceae bacterium]
MILKRELRRRAHQIVGPLLGMALTGYFAYNLVAGDRGLLAWMRLSRQLAAEQTTLAQERAERVALDLKVANLRPEHIDPDLLDERARAVLNLVAPDEIVVMRPRPAP